MLPGRLTTFHIDKAIERGDSYISYKGTVYSIEELRELDEVGRQRSSRVRGKRVAREDADNSTDKNSSGSGRESSDSAHAGRSPAGEELTEIGDKSSQ